MMSSPHFRGFIGPMKGLVLKIIASNLPSWTTSLFLRLHELTWSQTSCKIMTIYSKRNSISTRAHVTAWLSELNVRVKESDQYFLSQPFVVPTVDQFVGPCGGPLERKKP